MYAAGQDHQYVFGNQQTRYHHASRYIHSHIPLLAKTIWYQEILGVYYPPFLLIQKENHQDK